MKLYRFDADVGREISAYGSEHLVMSRLLRLNSGAHIGCMHIGPEGIVGYHQATTKQLFVVMQGTGWVRGEEEQRVPISAGQAAWWDIGEWHASGSEHGMVAIVIEGDDVDPSGWMIAWEENGS